MATVSLKKVSKSYGKVNVLDSIDLTIDKGEFTVVVGPSGCGKSSLLRMVAGLEQITSGEIHINSRCVNTVAPGKRDIAMVFQNYALYPHMSVYDNMAYGLKMRKLTKPEIDNEVRQVAKVLQLEDFLTRRPSELSGGQRQRVAMGRAIVRHPAVFLFDEPLSNLDAKLRTEMRLEIKKLQKKLAITSLYVTHDQTEAMTMADKIVVLNKGKVEQIATPDDIYHNPQSMFVAGFMGASLMNFIPANVCEQGKVIESAVGFKLKAPADVKPNQQLIIGIRPEHLSCVADVNSAQFGLNIDSVEVLGADKMVYGSTSKGNINLSVRMDYDSLINDESFLALSFDQSKLNLFDKITQQRVGD